MNNKANRPNAPDQIGPSDHDSSPDTLSYQKPDAVPGWDPSLWPKSGKQRWILLARLTCWRDLTSVLLTCLCLTVVSLFFASQALATLHIIELPPGWHVITSDRRAHLGALVSSLSSIFFGALTIVFGFLMI